MSKPVLEDLFAFSGRRNRKSYFLYFLALMGLWAVFFMLLAVPAANHSDAGMGMVGILGLILAIPSVISSWAVGGQRCRDFGWTAWAVLLTAIPYVGFLFAIAMMVIPGNVGENRYGPDPVSKV